MNHHRTLCVATIALSVAGQSCKSKPSDPPLERPIASAARTAPDAAADKPAPSSNAVVFELRGPGQRLRRTIGQFSIASPPRYFGPKNLYELINGGSESYISLGMKEMVTADYTSAEFPKVTVTVEIYDMASPKSASARFAKFLEGQQDPASAGKGLPKSMEARGLLGTANASFWKDRFLVNITLLDESDSASKETMGVLGGKLLPEFAKAIDDGI